MILFERFQIKIRSKYVFGKGVFLLIGANQFRITNTNIIIVKVNVFIQKIFCYVKLKFCHRITLFDPSLRDFSSMNWKYNERKNFLSKNYFTCGVLLIDVLRNKMVLSFLDPIWLAQMTNLLLTFTENQI